MKQTDGNFMGPHQGSIYYQYWKPERMPRAVILIVHGAAEHCARYQYVAEFFVTAGYAVAAYDHPGHGRSEGARCYIERFSHYVDTLECFRQRVAKEFPGLPIFLIGHSLGGLISSSYLLDHQDKIAACVLSGPALQAEVAPSGFQALLLRVIARFFPRSGALQLDAGQVCRDQAVVDAYRSDTLVYTGKLPARTVVELLQTMERVKEGAYSLKLPMLFLHGGGDTMTSPEGSRLMYDAVSSSNKVLKIYPELYHEIFNEPERDQVLADVLTWLEPAIG